MEKTQAREMTSQRVNGSARWTSGQLQVLSAVDQRRTSGIV
jgi:hypothetical protein